MMFLRRLFGRKEKPAAEELRAFSAKQTQAEQDATRKHMEDEVVADRKRRGATDVRPSSEQPPPQDPGQAPTDDA